MKIHIVVYVFLLSVILVSCVTKSKWNPPVELRMKTFNMEKFNLEFDSIKCASGISEKIGLQLSQNIDSTVKANSNGKYLKTIWVKNLSGSDSFLLEKLIKQKTLIVFIKTHCGFGSVHITKELPDALAHLRKEKIKVPVVCLYIMEPSDTLKSEYVISHFNEYKAKHKQTWIVYEKDISDINVIGSPTRIYITKEGKLLKYAKGAKPIPNLTEELKEVFD